MRGLGCYIPEEGESFLESYERAPRDIDAEIDELKERIDAEDAR